MPATKRNPQKPTRLFKNEQWQRCYEQFIASVTSIKSRALYQSVLSRFFASCQKTPNKVTRSDIEDFLSQTIKSGRKAGLPLSAYSRATYFDTICSFYTWCAKYHVEYRGKLRPILRGTKPTEGMRRAKLPEVERDLAEGEALKFFAAIDRTTLIGKRDYALFLSLLLTGRRRSEILNLLWGDLETVTFVENGKARSGYLYHWKGKGRLSKDDCAEWPEACHAALRVYLEARGIWGSMSPSTPLFRGTKGRGPKDVPLAGSGLNRRFRHYARLAGIGDNIVPHSLRHEHAWDRHENNGHNLLEVKDHLRHKNVSQTLKYIEKRRRRQQGDPVAAALAAKYASLNVGGD